MKKQLQKIKTAAIDFFSSIYQVGIPIFGTLAAIDVSFWLFDGSFLLSGFWYALAGSVTLIASLLVTLSNIYFDKIRN